MNSFDKSLFESSLNVLNEEAQALFKEIDLISLAARKLECDLKASKANFPFPRLMKIDDDSYPRPAEPRHQEKVGVKVEGSRIMRCYYLAWEYDDVSSQFRLLYIVKDKEIVFCALPDENMKGYQFQETLIFKRPFIETTLQTRLEYSKFLKPFADEFAESIKKSRMGIGQEVKPFLSDFSPF